MKRPVVAVCALALFAASACSVADPSFGPGETPVAVPTPDAVELGWSGFHLHLDPTVEIWADQTGVDVSSIVLNATRRIEQRLHGPPTSISIEAGSYWAIPDVGIGGEADRQSGAVHVSMDSRSPVPIDRMLRVWLPIALAHELHHSKRILQGPGYGATLLDAIVTEGSAEAFVRELYPEAPALPWVSPLPTGVERAVWRSAQRVLTAPDDLDVHQQWFVGGGSLPRWPGYRIGYEIAERYLARHPHATAAELAMLPTAQIFRNSGFAEAMAGSRARA